MPVMSQNDRLIELAHIPRSQQLILRYCSFAGESDADADADDSDESSGVDSWIPDEAAVGITMISAPEISEDDEVESARDDQFQTPPENLVSTSQEQRSAASGVDGGRVRGGSGDGDGDGEGESVCVDDDCTIIEGMVDLCEDTILGFSKVQTKYVNLKEHLNTTVNDRRTDGLNDTERIVDLHEDKADTELSQESDDGDQQNDDIVCESLNPCLEFEEGSNDDEQNADISAENPDTELSEESDHGVEQDDGTACENPQESFIVHNGNLEPHYEFMEGSDDNEQMADNLAENASKMVIRNHENLKPPHEVSEESGAAAQDDDFLAESMSKKMKLSNGSLTIPESSRATVELHKESCSAVENMEGIEHFNYVDTSGTDPLGRKRKLPATIVGRVEKVSEEAPVGEESHAGEEAPVGEESHAGEEARMGEEASAGSSKSPPYSTQSSVDCLLNVLKTLAMRSEPQKVEPGNLMKIAMRRGLNIPTPFWPPPDGPAND